jgi:predicted nucleotidyltransferase
VSDKLIPQAEEFLIANKISLPTSYYLKREINSFCARRQEKIFEVIYGQLSDFLILMIDEILEIIPGEDVTWFQKFKEYPPAASISVLQDYLRRYHKLASIDLSKIDMVIVSHDFSQYLYRLARYYNAYKMKRFKPAKRYTLMVLFLHESKKVIIDYLIQLHDQYISNICRECRNMHFQKLKLYKQKNEKAIDKIEYFIDFMLAWEDKEPILIDDIYTQTIKRPELQKARNDMHEYKALSRFGYAALIQNRYNSMRRYFSEFIRLPFLAEKGSVMLWGAIELIRQLDNQEIEKIPTDFNTKFIDKQLVIAMCDKQGDVKRSILEMGGRLRSKTGFVLEIYMLCIAINMSRFGI